MIDRILQELSTGKPILTEEEIRRAEQDINAKMEKFSCEWRAWMCQSRESASHAHVQ